MYLPHIRACLTSAHVPHRNVMRLALHITCCRGARASPQCDAPRSASHLPMPHPMHTPQPKCFYLTQPHACALLCPTSAHAAPQCTRLIPMDVAHGRRSTL
eukprot:jgi/Botrbrau1/11905/Bobra.0171s0015.1